MSEPQWLLKREPGAPIGGCSLLHTVFFAEIDFLEKQLASGKFLRDAVIIIQNGKGLYILLINID